MLILSLIEGHLGCFQVLAVMNKVAMNHIHVTVSCGHGFKLVGFVYFVVFVYFLFSKLTYQINFKKLFVCLFLSLNTHRFE